MAPFLAELIGTALILLFGCGVVAGVLLNKSKANGSGWIVICFAWAVGVTLGVYASGQFSGAHLNPAVTLGLAAAGKFPWEKVPGYILAQFLGAMIGAGGVFLAYYPHWEETEDPASSWPCSPPARPSTTRSPTSCASSSPPSSCSSRSCALAPTSMLKASAPWRSAA